MDIFEVMNQSEVVEETTEETFKSGPLYSHFDYINSISTNNNLFEGAEYPELIEKEYFPWMVNRGLSFFIDTIQYVNIVNENYHLDKKLQYDFLINTIRPKKRYSKWFKKEKVDDVDIIKEAFGYSEKKAEIALSVLSTEQIKEIKRRISQGGLKNEVNSRRSS